MSEAEAERNRYLHANYDLKVHPLSGVVYWSIPGMGAAMGRDVALVPENLPPDARAAWEAVFDDLKVSLKRELVTELTRRIQPHPDAQLLELLQAVASTIGSDAARRRGVAFFGSVHSTIPGVGVDFHTEVLTIIRGSEQMRTGVKLLRSDFKGLLGADLIHQARDSGRSLDKGSRELEAKLRAVELAARALEERSAKLLRRGRGGVFRAFVRHTGARDVILQHLRGDKVRRSAGRRPAGRK